MSERDRENVGWRELMKLRNRCHIDPDAIRVESLNLQLSQNPNLIKRDPEHTTSEAMAHTDDDGGDHSRDAVV